MKFGIIGTNFITEWFLQAGKECTGFKASAIYSRSMDKAVQYAQRHEIPCAYDSIGQLVNSPIDAVYIASPNAMHCAQALEALKAGKHVLCEKPIASNSRELEIMLGTARDHGLVLLEGAKNIFVPGFNAIKQHLHELGNLRRASFVFNQYSSRYDKYKAGIIENAFDPSLSNGALMDIGVYCVEAMVALFGAPITIQASAIKLSNGLDGQGFILAAYPELLVELSYSKISQSVIPSVIQGEDGSMLIDPFVNPRSLKIIKRNGEEKIIHFDYNENNMNHEIIEFMRFAETGTGAEPYNACSLESMRIMDEARRQQGIRFPTDI